MVLDGAKTKELVVEPNTHKNYAKRQVRLLELD